MTDSTSALHILELIADGWEVIESSGSMGEMTLQAPDDWEGYETETVFKFHTRSSAPEAHEGEARKVEWVNDASNVNNRRMYIDDQQWAKVYGWDKASLNARCDALQAAMQRTAAPSADKLREALEGAQQIAARLDSHDAGMMEDEIQAIDQALAALR